MAEPRTVRENANTLSSVQIAEILPHRYPFALVDRVLDYEPSASETAERAVENWRNSPGHFQTMINPDCDTIGVGISTDEGGTICFLFVGDPNAHNPYA